MTFLAQLEFCTQTCPLLDLVNTILQYSVICTEKGRFDVLHYPLVGILLFSLGLSMIFKNLSLTLNILRQDCILSWIMVMFTCLYIQFFLQILEGPSIIFFSLKLNIAFLRSSSLTILFRSTNQPLLFHHFSFYLFIFLLNICYLLIHNLLISHVCLYWDLSFMGEGN